MSKANKVTHLVSQDPPEVVDNRPPNTERFVCHITKFEIDRVNEYVRVIYLSGFQRVRDHR